MKRALALLLFLAACSNQTQTTSGATYKAARPDYNPALGSPIDQAVARAAAVEPLLRFPARIGLARIQNGTLVGVPEREGDAWIAFAQSHAAYGEFVPVSPLVAEMAQSGGGDAAKTVIDKIRLGASRQHLDAVLVYTATSENSEHGSTFSVLDLTLIGAFIVPSHRLKGEAVASALLLDVRNGYPYGTANAVDTQTGLGSVVGSNDKARDLGADAEVAAVGKLAAEVDTMMGRLRTELAEKELATLRAEHDAKPVIRTVAAARRAP